MSVPTRTFPNTGCHEQAAPIDLTKGTKFVAALGDIAVASGRTTDIWRGTWNRRQVAFKAFRIYHLQDLREAKKVL